MAEPTAHVPDDHRRHALTAARGRLQKLALKFVAYAALAYLLLRLLPALKAAFRTLGHVHPAWIAAAVGLETLSEFGFVVSWRAIVDPDDFLSGGGRGPRTAVRAAWAQLGGGIIAPGGAIANIGVGAWIMTRLGVPRETIVERQFNLSFLNTAVDALALVVFGLGLAIGLFSGEDNLLLTALPAGVAAAGIGAALLLARGAGRFAKRLEAGHPKISRVVASIVAAVNDTRASLLHRGGLRSVAGSVAYLGFDGLMLWSAFLAIHAQPLPSVPIVFMAYIIGALGGSIPLPAGIGAVGGIAGMMIVYGVGHTQAVAAVLLYEAIGLLVPLIGGGIAYLLLHRTLAAGRPPVPEGAHAGTP